MVRSFSLPVRTVRWRVRLGEPSKNLVVPAIRAFGGGVKFLRGYFFGRIPWRYLLTAFSVWGPGRIDSTTSETLPVGSM